MTRELNSQVLQLMSTRQLFHYLRFVNVEGRKFVAVKTFDKEPQGYFSQRATPPPNNCCHPPCLRCIKISSPRSHESSLKASIQTNYSNYIASLSTTLLISLRIWGRNVKTIQSICIARAVKVQRQFPKATKVTAWQLYASTFMGFALADDKDEHIQEANVWWDDKENIRRASEKITWKSKWIIGFMSRSPIKERKLFFWGWCIPKKSRVEGEDSSAFLIFDFPLCPFPVDVPSYSILLLAGASLSE